VLGPVTAIVDDGAVGPTSSRLTVVVELESGSGPGRTWSPPSEPPPESIATPRTATAAIAALPASTRRMFWCDHHDPGGGSYSSSASHQLSSSLIGATFAAGRSADSQRRARPEQYRLGVRRGFRRPGGRRRLP
jgi:hypothetical protein